MTTSPDYFPTETTGLPSARPPETLELADGDDLDLRIAPVAKRLGDATVRSGRRCGRRGRSQSSRASAAGRPRTD